MSLSAYAPGKLIIAGEYSVLFGGLALATSTTHRARARFEAGSHYSFKGRTNSARYKFYQDHSLLAALNHAAKKNKLALSCGTYYLDTSAFYDPKTYQKLGLGSSAAAITALSKLLLAQNRLNSQELLLKIALEAHRVFSHNFGSGIDVAASVYEQIIIFRKTETGFYIKPIDLSWWPQILWINTGRSQITRDFVKHVENFKNDKIIKHFVSESDICCEHLLKNTNFSLLRTDFERLYNLLYNLGAHCELDIISVEHQTIHELAYGCGGFAKPSGAGGGDISIAWVPPSRQADFIKQLKLKNFVTLS